MNKLSPAERAKPNRDRFVGFAFAGAHLLLETDNAGRITFAAGARCGLVTGTLDDMINHSVFDFVPLPRSCGKYADIGARTFEEVRGASQFAYIICPRNVKSSSVHCRQWS